MNRVYTIGISVAALVIGGAIISFGVAIVINTSPWFIWGLLPSQTNVSIVADNKAEILRGIANNLEQTPLKLPQEYMSYVAQARRIGFSKKADTTTLILLPKHLLRRTTRQELSAYLTTQGWQVQQYGLLIIAQKGTTLHSYTWHTAFTAARSWLKKRPIPKKILAYATWEQGTLSALENMSAAAAFIQKGNKGENVINLWLGATEEQLNQEQVPQEQLPEEDELFVAVPSNNIEQIPQELRQEIEATLARQLGFVATKPALIPQKKRNTVTILARQNEETAIGMQASETLTIGQQREEWIQALQQEEAYTRPQRKAFKLPDGTYGSEYVAGEIESILKSPDTEGCQQAQWNIESAQQSDVQLWLCTHENAVALGTEKALTQEARDTQRTNYWSARAGANWIQQLHPVLQNNVKSINIVGNNASIHLQMVLPE